MTQREQLIDDLEEYASLDKHSIYLAKCLSDAANQIKKDGEQLGCLQSWIKGNMAAAETSEAEADCEWKRFYGGKHFAFSQVLQRIRQVQSYTAQAESMSAAMTAVNKALGKSND